MVLLTKTGFKRVAKSVWRSFKTDFETIEGNLSAAKDDVDQEIHLASEMERHRCQSLLLNEAHEQNLHRQLHLQDMETTRSFRKSQSMALAKASELRIQKIVKENGNLASVRTLCHVLQAASQNVV